MPGYATVEVDTYQLAIDQFEAAAGFELSFEQKWTLQKLALNSHGVDAVIGAIPGLPDPEILARFGTDVIPQAAPL